LGTESPGAGVAGLATGTTTVPWSSSRKGLAPSPEEAVGLDQPELKPLEREVIAQILGSSLYICVSLPRGRSPLRGDHPKAVTSPASLNCSGKEGKCWAS